MPDPIRAISRLLPKPATQAAELPAKLPPIPIQLLKAVISGGDMLPQGQSGRPIYPTWNYELAVQEGYKRNPVVYRALSAVAQSAASIPYVAEISSDGENWEPDPTHPLSLLMKKPNPNTNGQQYIERMALDIQLGGNGLSRKVLASRQMEGSDLPAVLELQNLTPAGVAVVPDRKTFVAGYVFRRGSIEIFLPADESVHVQLVNPENPFWGMSPLQPLASVVDTSNRSVAWNLTSMEKRAVSSGVFSSKERITRPQWEDYRQMIAEQHQGSENAYAPWVLGGGFDWHEMDRSPVEMDFVESIKLWREQILSGAGVPPVMAGFFDDATLANAETSRKLFWIDFVLPFVGRITAELNRSVVPHFGNTSTLRLSAITTAVDALQEDLKEKASTHLMLQKGGVPYNESVTMLNLPASPQPAGEVPFGIVSQSGGSASAAPASAPAPAAAEDPDLEDEGREEVEDDSQASDSIPRELKQTSVAQSLIFPKLHWQSAKSARSWATAHGFKATKVDENDSSYRLRQRDSAEFNKDSLRTICVAPRSKVPAGSTKCRVKLVVGALKAKSARELPDYARRIEVKQDDRDMVAGILSIVATYGAEMEAATLAAIAEHKRTVKRARIERALQEENLELLLSAYDLPLLRDRYAKHLKPVFDQSTAAGGQQASQDITQQTGEEFVWTPALTAAWVAMQLTELVAELVTTTEKGIAKAYQLWTSGQLGDSVAKVSATFVGLYALNSNQATAALNFAIGLGPEPKLVSKVQRMQLAQTVQRSNLIGFHQSTFSVFEGQRSGWRAATGTIVPSAVKTWVDADDASVCPICISLDGQTIPMDELYFSPVTGQSYVGPGDPHPRCNGRCGEFYTSLAI